jgi:hypothetical protein
MMPALPDPQLALLKPFFRILALSCTFSKTSTDSDSEMNTNTKFFSAVIIPCLVAWFSQSAIAQSGTWTATGSLNTARYFHTATLLPNGQVLVAAGFNDASTWSASAELYDQASGTWTATGSLNTGRYLHTANLLPNGKVLVAGGNVAGSIPSASAELYDPASGT